MLGGGNPTSGANPTGIGKNLNFIRVDGKILAYAYSGVIGVSSSDVTLLEFTTGSEVCSVDLSTYSANDTVHGDDIKITLSFDGQKVAGFVIESTNSPATPVLPTPFVIAPFTKITLQAINLTGSTSRDVAATLVGEAYA
jgi:hypothetical protein